jgi:hypothetical protein
VGEKRRSCTVTEVTVGNGRMALAAVTGGFLLGFVDFVWIKFMPSPLADLGNSSAVWAVAAFGFGYWIGAGWLRGALGAATLLVVAVPSYGVAAALIQGDDFLRTATSTATAVWVAFGVLAGMVFGVGGVWARGGGRRRVVAAALPGAVLFAEALLLFLRIGEPSYGNDPLWPAVIRVVLGVAVTLLTARTLRQRAATLAVTVPLALLGLAAFRVGGFV